MLDYFRNFRKLNLSKISRYMVLLKLLLSYPWEWIDADLYDLKANLLLVVHFYSRFMEAQKLHLPM